MGHELLMQVERSGKEGVEVDVYKISNRVKPGPELAKNIEKYQLDGNYVLKNIVIDDFNEEQPCSVTIGGGKVIIEGRQDLVKVLKCENTSVFITSSVL